MDLDQALERIRSLEESLEQSKASHKRIKEDCRYIDYNRLLDRFNRQKTQNELYRNALIKVTTCKTVNEATSVALSAIEDK